MATNQTGSRNAAALLREVARLHVRAQRATLACDAVGNTSCTILTELGRAPAMTLAELARRLRLDKSWTSRAVDQLVAQELVDKAASDTDRRTITLSLTRAGRAEHRRLEAILNAQVDRVLSRVPAPDRDDVARALRLLLAAYTVELAEEPSEEARALCTVA